MRRASLAVWTILTFLGIASVATPAFAGPREWYAWTGEVSNDFADVNNWRWAGAYYEEDSGYNQFYHPADLTTLLSSRHEIGRATAGTPLPQTVNIGDGQTYAQTYGSIEIDSGMDFNIYNDSSFSVSGGVGANGVGTDPVRDNAQGYAQWTYNHLQTNIHVYSGGHVTISGGLDGGVMTFSGSATGNLGLFAEGLAHFQLGGNYVIGGKGNGNGYGGGHLSLKGWHADSTLSVAGTIEASAAKGIASDLSGSTGARFEITLDASNNTGQFNTITADKLSIYSPDSARTDMVKFNLALDGYTPTPGQVFPIIVANSIEKVVNLLRVESTQSDSWSATPDDLGDVSVTHDNQAYVWDSTFVVGGGSFKLHKAYNGQVGLFLEVVSSPVVIGPHMGDANHDEKVDLQDFSLLKAYYGQTGQPWEHGNFNNDANGLVNLEDFSLLKAHYNHTGNANTTPLTLVPEPGTTAMLLAGLAGLLRRRR